MYLRKNLININNIKEINSLFIEKDLNENIINTNFNESEKSISRTAIVFISFSFVILFIFLLVFTIILRRQTTEVIISIKISRE